MTREDHTRTRETLLTGILLVNLGSPEQPTPASIRRYLKEFLHDRRVVEVPRYLWFFILRCIILPLRSARVARLYASVWTDEGAPLVVGTRQLAEKLKKKNRNKNIQIGWAMRYGQPSLMKVLDEWQQQGLRRLIVIPLYPQYAASTTATIFDQLADHFKQQPWLPQIHFISGYHDHQLYIRAIANSIRRSSDSSHYLLLSFHGLPQFMLEQGDPYYCFCHASARLIAQELGLEDNQWQLTFQSRFGRQPWLQPYTDKVLEQLPCQGIDTVRIACPGFAIDCLETLEETVITNRDVFFCIGRTKLSLYFLSERLKRTGAIITVSLCTNSEALAASG